MIEAKNLSMNYGSTRALDRVSFAVNDNEIVGLLGPNGAGKTTIMRILTTFIYPTGGTATINGIDVTEDPIRARRSLGYLPETPPLYTDMRVDEFIRFIGCARNLGGNRLKERIDWVVENCGIGPVWKHQIFELSLGYRQRVGLAQALLHDPSVIVLDEPTSGLDPIQIIGIRNLIRGLAKSKTVIFSTHILQEASAISNRLLIINQGRIVAQGAPSELRGGSGKEELFYCTLGADRLEAENALSGIKSIKRAVFVEESRGGQRFQIAATAYDEAVKALNELVRTKNWSIKELSPDRASLEDVFVSLFKKSVKKNAE